MTTLVARYIKEIRDVFRSTEGFPAPVEDSPVRAHGRNANVVMVMLGQEKIVSAALPRVTRQREIHVTTHTTGDEHLEISEGIFAAAHPLVMHFSSDGIIQIDELQTDEPKYANADLTRQVVARRYLITYQTLEDSLSK